MCATFHIVHISFDKRWIEKWANQNKLTHNVFTVGFYSSPIDEIRGIGTQHKSKKEKSALRMKLS